MSGINYYAKEKKTKPKFAFEAKVALSFGKIIFCIFYFSCPTSQRAECQKAKFVMSFAML